MCCLFLLAVLIKFIRSDIELIRDNAWVNTTISGSSDKDDVDRIILGRRPYVMSVTSLVEVVSMPLILSV